MKKKDEKEKKIKRKLSFRLCLILSIIGVVMGASIDMLGELDFSMLLIYYLVMGALMLMTPCYVLYSIYDMIFGNIKREKEEKVKKREIARQQLEGIAVLVGSELRLSARSEYLADMIDIVGATTDAIYKNPEVLHVGAVTVGGVTTGGTYTTGGQLYQEEVSVSGHYFMLYDGKLITKILLKENLQKEAQSSEIMPYLEDMGKVIAVYKQPSFNNYLATDTNQFKYDLMKGYPSKEKANAILKWISNKK